MKNKFAIILLAFICLFAFAGCNKNNSNITDSSSSNINIDSSTDELIYSTTKEAEISDYLEGIDAQPFTNDNLYELRSSMWYFLDGENDNFCFVFLQTEMYQYFNGRANMVEYQQREYYVYLKNIYRGIYNSKNDQYDLKLYEAMIYVASDGDSYFKWLNTNEEPLNLTKHQQEYSRSGGMYIDKYSPEFIENGF